MKELTSFDCQIISAGKSTESLALGLLSGIVLGGLSGSFSSIYIYPHFAPVEVIAVGTVGAHAGAVLALSLFMVLSICEDLIHTKFN